MAKALGFRFDYEREQDKEKDKECVTDLVNLSRIEKPRDLKLPKFLESYRKEIEGVLPVLEEAAS